MFKHIVVTFSKVLTIMLNTPDKKYYLINYLCGLAKTCEFVKLKEFINDLRVCGSRYEKMGLVNFLHISFIDNIFISSRKEVNVVKASPVENEPEC